MMAQKQLISSCPSFCIVIVHVTFSLPASFIIIIIIIKYIYIV